MFYRLAASLLLISCAVQAQEGPSILTRPGGTGMHRRGGRDPLFLRAWAGLGGSYETGINPIGVDSQGRLQDVALEGLQLDFGATGERDFRKTIIALDYRGDFRHYAQTSNLGGSDQFISLSLRNRVARRAELGLVAAAATATRSNSGYVVSQFYDPNLASAPLNELFDERYYYAQFTPTLDWQLSRRWSVEMGGQGFAVRRNSSLLVGTNGYGALADVAYRLSKRSTIDVGYQFMHFDFDRSFGQSDLHMMVVGYSRKLPYHFEISGNAGAVMVDTLGTETIVYDPAIAALTGFTSGIRAFNRTNVFSQGGVRLSKSYHKSNLSLDFSRVISPGNGLYLTSRNDAFSASFSHTAARRWNIGTFLGYSRNGSISQTAGTYGSTNGGVGVTYKIRDSLHFNSRIDVRNYTVNDTRFSRLSTRIVGTLTFSPGELPLTLW